MWLPVLDNDGTQATHHDGRPLWTCHTGTHRLRGTNPRGDCPCEPASTDRVDEPLPPCKLLGEQLGEVGCGCGAREKKLPVYQCGAGLGPCIERSANKSGLRFNGEKVVVCLGCSKREA